MIDVKTLPKEITHIIGIDEVGRGPLAGPVTLGFAIMKREHLGFLPNGITDSKLLTPKKREAFNGEMRILMKKGILKIFTVSVSAQDIDRYGINPGIRSCIDEGCQQSGVNPKNCQVLLDGGLKVGDEYIYQETIIKGDQKEPLIGAASVHAKVVRDKYMKDLDKEFPLYGFGKHKGYGTKDHRKAILELNPCKEHRLTYLRKLFAKKTV